MLKTLSLWYVVRQLKQTDTLPFASHEMTPQHKQALRTHLGKVSHLWDRALMPEHTAPAKTRAGRVDLNVRQ